MSEEISILPIQSFYWLDDRTVAATVLHQEPLIMKFERLLTDDECQQLIKAAAPRLRSLHIKYMFVSLTVYFFQDKIMISS